MYNMIYPLHRSFVGFELFESSKHSFNHSIVGEQLKVAMTWQLKWIPWSSAAWKFFGSQWQGSRFWPFQVDRCWWFAPTSMSWVRGVQCRRHTCEGLSKTISNCTGNAGTFVELALWRYSDQVVNAHAILSPFSGVGPWGGETCGTK